jgi:hypothetical protein
MDRRLIMSNIESMAHSTLPGATHGRVSAALITLIAISGSLALAGGCADLGEDPGAGLVDASLPDASLPDAGLPDASLPDAAPEPATPVYFLVAELPGEVDYNDSYVLPLTNPDHIAHARDLIARGPQDAGTHIVVATIRAGADGINRNVRAEGQPAWSWHVTDMVVFADATMEILDGWPSFVEQDVAGWIANTCFNDETHTYGTLGFWGYTVVEELEDYPPSQP